MPEELVTVFTNLYSIHTHLIKTRLESENIECFILDENTVTIHPLYANAIGGVKLQVRIADEARARIILKEIEGQLNQP